MPVEGLAGVSSVALSRTVPGSKMVILVLLIYDEFRKQASCLKNCNTCKYTQTAYNKADEFGVF